MRPLALALALTLASPAYAKKLEDPTTPTAFGTVVGLSSGALLGGVTWALAVEPFTTQSCGNRLDCGVPHEVRSGLFGAPVGAAIGASTGAFLGYARAGSPWRNPWMLAGLGAAGVGSGLVLSSPRHDSVAAHFVGVGLCVAVAPTTFVIGGVFSGERGEAPQVALSPSPGGLTLSGRF
ncbi:MAG: hypothetical protein H6741_25375 [Alphaproteobacteria bacterium]|nr:hypothetical protein [Alphaproteobacteria bacterium]